MSTEAINVAETNREAAYLATADAQQAQRIATLWGLPTIADSDIPDALQIPRSLWAQLKSEGDTPPLFEIGRRLFARTDDLRSWLYEKAQHGRPGSKRLRKTAA